MFHFLNVFWRRFKFSQFFILQICFFADAVSNRRKSEEFRVHVSCGYIKSDRF